MTDRIITIYESEWQDRYEQGIEDAIEKMAKAVSIWTRCNYCPVSEGCWTKEERCEKRMARWLEEVVKDDSNEV